MKRQQEITKITVIHGRNDDILRQLGNLRNSHNHQRSMPLHQQTTSRLTSEDETFLRLVWGAKSLGILSAVS